ncbi:hypothetical protein [Pontibacter oryzae]|nr:hypothetical protein [Pontibacter oryzae]
MSETVAAMAKYKTTNENGAIILERLLRRKYRNGKFCRDFSTRGYT